MTNKALVYAEENLGVHTAHEKAVKARNDLDQIFTELSEKQDVKRDLQDRLTDAEMVILSDERGKHPDMSAAAMEKHLKAAYNADGDVRTLRDQIRTLTGDIEGLEYDAKICEHDIRINTARMTELGGYFIYLATVKAEAREAKEAKNPQEQQ